MSKRPTTYDAIIRAIASEGMLLEPHHIPDHPTARQTNRDQEADILVSMLMDATDSQDVHERCKRFLGVRS